MDNTKNLDDYLAGLGISEPGEAVLPAPPQSGPTASTSGEAGESGAEFQPPGTLSPQETLEQFLTGLLSRVDPELTLTLRQGEGALEAEIQGAQAARLAGRDGRVLAAIEVLAYAALSRQGHNEVRVRIDAGGFRRRHAENLSKVAERLAVQVAKTGEAHEMQPMPPADRRVFHLALQGHPLVQTESIGEGPSRRLIIMPRTDPVATVPAPGTSVSGSPSSDDAVTEAQASGPTSAVH
ncbi:protein jag [Deinococcus radiomollis]|uniref:Jag family protein n=1 Tax=Deinococcus radiomollis TaxID=468916 RepID=UPI003891AD49